MLTNFPKIKSVVQLYELITEEERIITDVLRQILIAELGDHVKEKISYNVPFFYGNRSICLVWPASVPRGGIKEGVLLAFWYGNRLNDKNNYLTHGSNKQVYYKIFKKATEIRQRPLIQIIREANRLDLSFKPRKS